MYKSRDCRENYPIVKSLAANILRNFPQRKYNRGYSVYILRRNDYFMVLLWYYFMVICLQSYTNRFLPFDWDSCLGSFVHLPRSEPVVYGPVVREVARRTNLDPPPIWTCGLYGLVVIREVTRLTWIRPPPPPRSEPVVYGPVVIRGAHTNLDPPPDLNLWFTDQL